MGDSVRDEIDRALAEVRRGLDAVVHRVAEVDARAQDQGERLARLEAHADSASAPGQWVTEDRLLAVEREARASRGRLHDKIDTLEREQSRWSGGRAALLAAAALLLALLGLAVRWIDT